MRLFANIAMSLALLLGATPSWAEDLSFRLVVSQDPAPAPTSSQTPTRSASAAPSSLLGEAEVLLGDAVVCTASPNTAPAQSRGFNLPAPPAGALVACSASGASNAQSAANGYVSLCPIREEDYVIRGQFPDQPPPASPFGGPTVPGPPPSVFGPANPNDCGINDGKAGGFWQKCCDNFKNGCKDLFSPMGQMFQGGPDHQPFRSDHAFDFMISPVSEPFLTMDPRSLTEVRPIFIYQQTRTSNPLFAGGSNYFVGAQGSLALTDRISMKISELGLTFMEPRDPSNNRDFQPNVGPSEFHFGPQFTFIRNVEQKLLVAGGMTFEVAWGSEKEFQHTGDVGFTPYASVAWTPSFTSSKFGSLDFMNTTGWSGGPERSGFLFSNFHFDYNVMNLGKFYPLVEVNWAVYTNSGNQYAVNFEGLDMFNFGGTNVAGTNMCTLNVGARYKINDFWWLGLTGGWSLIGGGGQLDGFRLTFDMIFRY